ncbi:MAG: tol-pal system protein YbgF [Burkholderiales bacterium]|nr:tol-pal system protein YbgF [Burkholderiales bacterium]
MALAFGLVLSLAAGTAHAGLFDDDEARKAIVDLRNRITALEDQGKAQADAAAASAEQMNALRRSLLDMSNQLEDLRSQIAKLRGDKEQLARDLSDLQRKQQDTTQAFDDRLRKLEPTKVSVDGRDFTVTPGEKRAYDDAIAAIRGGDFDKSAQLLTAFQSAYPGSGYADSVRFWLGNALYGKRDYKGAIAAFRAYVTAAPDSPHAPDALLAMANSQAEMKETKAARRTLGELLKNYPQSDAARAGKERLGALR